MRRRNKRISFRLSEENYNNLKNKAKLIGMNQSELIRKWIMNYQVRPKPSQEFYDDINNFHELATAFADARDKLYKEGIVDDEQLKENLLRLKIYAEEIRERYIT